MMQCGLDEAGRGPVIGPMVIAMVCGDSDKLAGLGVKDSKLLSPARREALLLSIENSAESVRVRIVSVAEINMEMRQATMNEIEHSRYLDLIMKAKYPAYVDAFDVNAERLEARLSRESGREVHAMHRADSIYAVVSAASIVAKVKRDSLVREIEKEYGHFGSGYPSDPRTIGFLKRCIADKVDVSGIVRREWITWKRLQGAEIQKDLGDHYTNIK